MILLLSLTITATIWTTWPISPTYTFNKPGAPHEIGHQAAATEIGVDGSRMQFFTVQDGQFFTGLSNYDSIPFAGKLPYAAAGFAMSKQVFNFGLASYQDRPTTFNKALMFFAATDFLFYTAYANYISSRMIHGLIRIRSGRKPD